LTIQGPTRTFKSTVYKHLARLGKALSSGPRLEILDLLTQGPRTVESIATEIGQSVANTSHHLRTLARARLVDADRTGLFVTYRVVDDDVSILFAAMRALGERQLRELTETTARFLADRGGCEAIDAAALRQRLDAGDVTLIDVRPASEFAAGHLPGAINIPAEELDARLAEIPAERDVVAYCRGPFCVMAVDAAAALRERGLRASHFDRSVADWRALGLPVETGRASSRA
jgi:rhodanese-related sulfurtransferase/predicted transcriptional regulator